jgi:AcrR family transcriptional regulator
MAVVLPSDQGSYNQTRREQLVTAAARLFAERGFHGVTIEELGAAVGISGPGFYKHFASKDAVLAEMLIGISEHLLAQGTYEVDSASSPLDALERLLTFHTDFALTSPDLIRVQDRDLANLPVAEARRVRRLQRAYVELWVEVISQVETALSLEEARTRAHAIFGLLNSTPHSAATRDPEAVAPTLHLMARAALTAQA